MSSITSFFAGAASSRRSNASHTGEASSIAVSDITEVRRGIQTEVLLKAKLIDPSCCLSLVTPQRTLDLTLRSAIQRDRILRGLRAVLDSLGIDARFT